MGGLILVLGGTMLAAPSALAIDPTTLPQGGNVVAGSATIEQTGTARLDITQQSQRAVIDWHSFDIGSAAHTAFHQPGSDAIAVNRVTSGDPTQILGQLSANGRVMVLNPNGVLFGPDSRVDVAGLVAATGAIDTDAFMAGDNRLELNDSVGTGGIINHGTISVAESGLAAFVAPYVANDGTIDARLGRVELAAGTRVTLDLYGDRLVEIALDGRSAVAGTLVDQAGTIVADGGHVRLSAEAARELVDDVINMSGVVQARAVSTAGGDIVLDGGDGAVTVAGTLDVTGASGGGSVDIRGAVISTADSAVLTADATAGGDGGTIVAYAADRGDYAGTFSASAGNESGDGGFIETSGKAVRIDSGISVDTSAPEGRTGVWSIDPVDLSVGSAESDTLSAATVVANMASTGMTLSASESITVNEAIDTTSQSNSNTLHFDDQDSDNSLTIDLNAAITLAAGQTLSGEGSTVNVGAAAGIQNGIDVAASGAAVNVAAGTFVESVAIDKALAVTGAGAGSTILTTESGSAVTVDGDIGNDESVVLDGFTFRDAPVAGVRVAGDTALGRLTIRNSAFDGNDRFGFLLDGSPIGGSTVANVELLDSSFTANGTTFASAASLGQGDIQFNYFNNDATLHNLTITGYGDGGGAHVGIQFRGVNTIEDAGTIAFDNVSVTGNYRRPSGSAGTWNPEGPGDALHILEYASVENVSFNDVTLAPTIGHGLFAEGLSTTLDLGNTLFGTPDAVVTGTGIATRSHNIVSGQNDNNDVRTNIDATTATFADVSKATLAGNFAIEDRVYHRTDRADLGLVTWNTGNVYVTEDSGSIQRAVDAAASGNSIHVDDGTYGAFATSFGGPSDITIEAAGDSAVIDASSGAPNTRRIVDLRADGTELSGFTIAGPGADAGVSVGISISGRNITAADNTITDVLTGIQTTTQYAAGNNSISGNTINSDYGISLQNTGNTVSGNNVGAAVEGVGLLPGANTFTGNTFTIGDGGDAMVLYGGALASTLDNSANEVTVGAGASLQGGIDLAGENGVLTVGAGTFTGDLTIAHAMRLVGAGADATTITGQAGGQTAAVTIAADDVTLGGTQDDSGFRIEGAGIRAVHLSEGVSDATIRNNMIVAAENQIALDTAGSQSGHTIQANSFTATGSGTTEQLVYIYGAASLGSSRASQRVDILDNSFSGSAQLALGQEAADSRIEGNSFAGTNSFAALELWAVPQSLSGNAFSTATDAHLRLSANAATGALDYGAPATLLAANDFATSVVNGSVTGAVATGETATIFGRIQAAVDAAVAGDTLNVGQGTYAEAITIDRALTLNGAQAGKDARSDASAPRTPGGNGESIVDGGDSIGTLIRIAADDVTIDGFEIRNGTGDLITSSSSSTIANPVIRNNIVHGSSGDEGMQIRNSRDAVIEYNRVYDTVGDGINLAGDNVGGIVSSTGGAIRYNEVHDIASPDGGIYVYGSTDTTIQGNRVHDVLGNDGIKLGDKTGADTLLSGGSILDNIVENSIQDGISVYSSNVTVNGNTVRDSRSDNGAIFVDFDVDNVAITNNVIEDSGTGSDAFTTFGIRVGKDQNPTNVTVSGNTLTNNEAQLFHKNGADDLTSVLLANTFDRSVLVTGANTVWSGIQDGIDAASAGDTITVGAGSYSGGVDIDKEGLTLSGTSASTISVASASGTALANTGFTVNADDVTIDGFTLRGPYDGEDYRAIDWSGEANSYGIVIASNRSGTTISDNDIAGLRTGIRINANVTDTTITGNTIDNTKGGVLLRSDEAGIAFTDNRQGAIGNEWGIVLNLHDIASGGAATASRQAEILAFSSNNGGISVLDRKYDSANRTHVSVDDDGTATAADDFGFGNALGNPNQPLSAIADGIDAVVAGGTVNVAAGTYAGGISLNKQGVTLAGADGAVIDVADSSSASGNDVNGINISADDVTVSGFDIAGPVDESWLSYAWGALISRGIAIFNGVTGFTIEDNDISDVRNGILIDGRNTGTVRNNIIDNTKSGISVQYTDGSDITIASNQQGSFGNEWGLNLHLNGNWNGSTISANPTATAPSAAWQQALLSLSTANDGWSVQDQTYTQANRTHVNVAKTGSNTNQGSALTPRATIASGIAAVVAGGTVNIGAGTYSENVTIDKALTLSGAGTDQTRIAPSSGSPITINANNVTVAGINRVTPTPPAPEVPKVQDVIPTTPTPPTTPTSTTTSTTSGSTTPTTTQADLPEPVVLNTVAPAAGAGATGGGAPAPQLVVTNDTSSVGSLIGGGNVVVLDLGSGIDSFSSSTSLTPSTPAAPAPAAPAGPQPATPTGAQPPAQAQPGAPTGGTGSAGGGSTPTAAGGGGSGSGTGSPATAGGGGSGASGGTTGNSDGGSGAGAPDGDSSPSAGGGSTGGSGDDTGGGSAGGSGGDTGGDAPAGGDTGGETGSSDTGGDNGSDGTDADNGANDDGSGGTDTNGDGDGEDDDEATG